MCVLLAKHFTGKMTASEPKRLPEAESILSNDARAKIQGRLSRESGRLEQFAAFGHKKTEQQLCWHLVNEAYSSFVPIEKVNSDYGATKIHTLHRRSG